jgi:hypothetical protein
MVKLCKLFLKLRYFANIFFKKYYFFIFILKKKQCFAVSNSESRTLHLPTTTGQATVRPDGQDHQPKRKEPYQHTAGS